MCGARCLHTDLKSRLADHTAAEACGNAHVLTAAALNVVALADDAAEHCDHVSNVEAQFC